MIGKRYFRVGQFSGPAPAEKEKFRSHILSGDAEEVTEDFQPGWGDAVYSLSDDGEIKEYKNNWDTSD